MKKHTAMTAFTEKTISPTVNRKKLAFPTIKTYNLIMRQ